MTNPHFISISGLAGSGKTTISNHIKQYFTNEYYDINEFSFAGPLKDALCLWFGWDRKRLDNDFAYKEGDRLDDGSLDPYCERLGMTRRVIMQKFGTECMRHGMHSDFWIIMADLGLHLDKLPHSDIFIIIDSRFKNELNWAKSINAYRILVTRAECQRDEDPKKIKDSIKKDLKSGATLTSSTNHASEKEFLEWNDYDEIIINLIDHNLNLNQNKNTLIAYLNDNTIPLIRDRFSIIGKGIKRNHNR